MKKKKERINPRKILAQKLYKDPKSITYLKATESLRRAGYSEKTAIARQSDILGDINFTDADYTDFKTFIGLIPQIDTLMRKKMNELSKSDTISAKDFSNLINLLEKLAKMSGIMKHIIEKRELKVIITAPADILEWEELKIELKYYKEKLARLERRSVIDIGEEYKKEAIDVG